MKGLTCPKCGKDNHDPKYEKDNFYVCSECGTPIGYLCTGCDKIYLENRLVLHEGTYKCKLCGSIQWGYTEWKKIGER